MERGRIQGLSKFFEYPFIISGMGKATNFKFCTHILSIDRKFGTKAHYKFREK